MLQWKGVYPAITTQFDEKNQLDLEMFEKNLFAQVEAGVEGVIIGGTLGESSVLTNEELETLVRFTVDKVKGKIPVVLNISEGATKNAIKIAESGYELGVEGFMLLPPMRYKSDHRETVTFFKTVAAATDLPILLYNNPVDYKVGITLDMFEELQEYPNINAVKESTRDVTNITRMRNRFGDRFNILCGVDTLALECLLMGADGWVGGLVNAFPEETVAIYRLVKVGKIEEAIKIHRWFLPLLELDIVPKLIQYIKLAAAQTEIGAENVRPPRLPLTGKEREMILNIIKEGIKTRPELPDYSILSI